MTTTDKNKLIAEFIGAKESQYKNEYEMYNFVSCIEDGENEQHYFKPEDMRFHYSWDWLMPVVEKIENTKCRNLTFNVFIRKNKTHIHYSTNNEWFSNIFLHEGKTKIENTYNACVEFINYYNQNNL